MQTAGGPCTRNVARVSLCPDVETRTDLERARSRLTSRIDDLSHPLRRINVLFDQVPGFAKFSERRRQVIARELLAIEDQVDRLCNQLTTMAGELGSELSAEGGVSPAATASRSQNVV
jgi:hypothetical protein